jgi:hypothetical protein
MKLRGVTLLLLGKKLHNNEGAAASGLDRSRNWVEIRNRCTVHGAGTVPKMPKVS